MGLKGKLAGEILGPRPGLMIVSFFGGRVEIILRILAILLGSVPVLIAAAVALATLRGVENIDDEPDDSDLELRDNTYAATGVAIAVACFGIIYEVVFIGLRFLNIGLLNLKSKIFLFVDIVISFVLAAGHFIAGVLEAFYAGEWNDDIHDGFEDRDTIRNSMIASAVFCFIGTALFVLLGVFMVIFLMKDWNSKVVKATVKAAVTG